MKPPPVYREMTELERRRALALGSCSLPIASFVKRFGRTMREEALREGPRRITEKQADRLEIEVYRYRRQILEGSFTAVVPSEPPSGYQTPTQRKAEVEAAGARRKIEILKEEEERCSAVRPGLADEHKEGVLL